MPTDPVEQLQSAARQVAGRFVPGALPVRVAILGADGEPLFVVAVPQVACESRESPREPEVSAGWDVTERRALFDGKPVKVAPSRLRLLKVLVEADAPLPARDLLGPAFDRHTSENNARFHVTELRKELRAAFPGFEGEVIDAAGDGYVLVVR
jgi:DNA-binding winged-HTH domains